MSIGSLGPLTQRSGHGMLAWSLEVMIKFQERDKMMGRDLPTCVPCDDFQTCDTQLKEKVENMRAKLRLS